MRNGKPHAIPAAILISGTEKYLKEKAINDLRLSLLDGSSGELDYKVLHGPETSADEILSLASTIPFFSSKRLIVIKEFDKLPKEDSRRVLDHIKNPDKHACIVVESKDDSIIKDDPSLAGCMKIMKFSSPTESEISSWVSKFISSAGKAIDENAIDILKELKGQDLLGLSQELEKLITYTGSRNKITSSDVEGLVGKSVMASAFDIAHAAAEADTAKAISIVRELSVYGKRPYEIVGLLAWHFKTLSRIRSLLSNGGTEYSITRQLGLTRRNAHLFFIQSSLYTDKELGSKLDILLEADLGLKRARYSPSLILELAIVRLCLAG